MMYDYCLILMLHAACTPMARTHCGMFQLQVPGVQLVCGSPSPDKLSAIRNGTVLFNEIREKCDATRVRTTLRESRE